MINEIRQDLVISKQIKADVGINISNKKSEPEPLLKRAPTEFFMNDQMKIDHTDDTSEGS